MPISGQWNARYSGNHNNEVVVDIDDVGDHYEGAACLWEANLEHPCSLLRFSTLSKDLKQEFDATLLPMLNNGDILTPQTINQLNFQKKMTFPATAKVIFEFQSPNFSITWSDTWSVPEGSFGSGTATAVKPRPSEMEPLPVRTWSQFKKYVSNMPKKKFIFRGHRSNQWRLRSSFHRARRANLDKYFFIQDVNDLQKIFSGLIDHPFDLQNAVTYGAFLNLAQHHGYPTPLLDWTWSPFVAAFFAYRNISMEKKPKPLERVRIYQLHAAEWNKLLHGSRIFPHRRHMTILDAISLCNPRSIPQQSISTMSNIDDIETYISEIEAFHKKRFLEVIDLPAVDRNDVMHELALMGITAGSMFPGLDGACEALRERNFESAWRRN